MNRLDKFLCVGAVLLMAALALYRSPYDASDLTIVPDSVEYAAGAVHLAKNEGYFVAVDAKKFPPRYSPCFPALLTPAYWIPAGDRIGNGILVVFALGLMGVVLAYATAARVSGPWGGACAAILILLIPDYTAMGRMIMSDVPASALLLMAYLLFMLTNPQSRFFLAMLFVAGSVIAIGGGVRPVTSVAILPFLLMIIRSPTSLWRRLLQVAILAAPLACVGMLTGLYNIKTFGGFFRTGYNFWCPVPYDSFPLTWSHIYLSQNLATLLSTPVIAMACLVPLLLWLRRRSATADPEAMQIRRLLVFAVFTALPLTLVHLFYFFQSARFFLPAACMLAVPLGAVAGLFCTHTSCEFRRMILLMIVSAFIVVRLLEQDFSPVRRMTADMISALTPPNAVIVSSIDPAYLELTVTSGTSRRIIPLSRSTEYASKLVAPRRMTDIDPRPAGWWDHRCAGLSKAGAIEAVERVTSEDPSMLEEYLAAHRRIFLVLVNPADADLAASAKIADKYRLIEHRPFFYEITGKIR